MIGKQKAIISFFWFYRFSLLEREWFCNNRVKIPKLYKIVLVNNDSYES